MKRLKVWLEDKWTTEKSDRDPMWPPGRRQAFEEGRFDDFLKLCKRAQKAFDADDLDGLGRIDARCAQAGLCVWDALILARHPGRYEMLTPLLTAAIASGKLDTLGWLARKALAERRDGVLEGADVVMSWIDLNEENGDDPAELKPLQAGMRRLMAAFAQAGALDWLAEALILDRDSDSASAMFVEKEKEKPRMRALAESAQLDAVSLRGVAKSKRALASRL